MKIAVSGYYGFRNAGDEAILCAIKEAFADHKLYILDKNNRFNYSFIRKSDVLISGGGGLLQDKTSNRSFLYYIGTIILAKLFKKKVYIFAQSIGPITNPINKAILKRVLNKVDLITVRDSFSFDFIESLQLKGIKLVHTSDPALILTPHATADIDNGLIGLCPRVFKGAPENIAELFAGLCDELSDKLQAKIALIPFQDPQDSELCQKIFRRTKIPVQILKWNSDPTVIMGYISKMKLVIGMRLHSLIFAVATKVPAIGISYDPKVEAFANEASIPVHNFEVLHNPGEIVSEVKEMLDHPEGIQNSLEIVGRKLYANSELNFALLNSIFKEETK